MRIALLLSAASIGCSPETIGAPPADSASSTAETRVETSPDDSLDVHEGRGDSCCPIEWPPTSGCMHYGGAPDEAGSCPQICDCLGGTPVSGIDDAGCGYTWPSGPCTPPGPPDTGVEATSAD